MNRLLTDEEILRAIEDGFRIKNGVTMGVIDGSSISQAQDTKTLKAVGEWLEKYHEEHSTNGVRYQRISCDICLNQLKQGKMPEEG